MQVTYRKARPDDAAALLAIKKTVWPEEEATQQQMEQTLSITEHICLVAQVQEQVVGFMDCFTTTSAAKELRFEMDLLAVQPSYQGNGIASAMIAGCLQQAASLPLVFCRSLIQVNNIASQRAFQHNGFSVQHQPLNLYVKFMKTENDLFDDANFGGQPVYVNTLGYTGYWIEPPFTTHRPLLTQSYQTVGTLIPVGSHWEQQAQKTGYELMNQYQWWIKPVREAT
jgi:ribosomal protein S18 acetylase RimI-like enzyme